MPISMEARYFAVKNWDKFQHYKQRNPPWIRLHRTLLRDHKFNQLAESEQWMLVRLWLLASETDNYMAFDEKWVRRAINSSRKVPIEKFLSMGFLEEVGERFASTPLAVRERSAEPEAEADSSEADSSKAEHGYAVNERVLKLLAVCRDATAETPGVFRRLLERAPEGDVAWAIECATGPGVVSPTRVAVAELTKRAANRRAA